MCVYCKLNEQNAFILMHIHCVTVIATVHISIKQYFAFG